MGNKSRIKTDKITLSPTLRTIPAAEGVTRLRELNRTFGLTPAPAAGGLNELLTGLEQVLLRTNISTLELADNAGPTLSFLTGVPAANLTDYHRTEVADRLHAYRNLALATAALAASTIEVTSTATAPAAIYAHAIRLRRRSIQLRRPLADDEIVLCRVAAYLASRVDPCDHAASIGTLLFAGLVPCETTQVRIDDFDDPAAPTILLAAGNAQLEARYIELDSFASHILGRHMQQALRAGRSRETPLTYRPRKRKQGPKHLPGSTAATASAQGVIDRFIAQLGLPTGDITATSLTQWRCATVLATEGIQAALAVSGRHSVESMFRALGVSGVKPVAEPDDDGESFAAAA
jgi:hypothetical protein